VRGVRFLVSAPRPAETIEAPRSRQRQQNGRSTGGRRAATIDARNHPQPASTDRVLFATYDRAGLSFAYPENWVLEEDRDEQARLNLTVTSPNTAFWTLIVYAEVLDLTHVVDHAVEALKAEYPELEADEAGEEVAGQPLRGQDARFFYLDLTSTARVRACHRGAATYLILCQAEDREFEAVEPVFGAITQSLLAGAPPTAIA